MRSERPIIMRPTPSLRSFPNVGFETVPMFRRTFVESAQDCDVRLTAGLGQSLSRHGHPSKAYQVTVTHSKPIRSRSPIQSLSRHGLPSEAYHVTVSHPKPTRHGTHPKPITSRSPIQSLSRHGHPFKVYHVTLTYPAPITP